MLSPARSRERLPRSGAKVEPRVCQEGIPGLSSQQRLLENELKLAGGTDRAGEGGLQMLNGLEKWIRMGTIRWALSAAQANADYIQSTAQPLEQMVNRLQSQGRLDRVKN